MSWFTKDNDDDIDDIYDKLDDIYNKLDALDVVNTFSNRISDLEKTSAYFENVLADTIKNLEKRIDKVEKYQENVKLDITSINNTMLELENNKTTQDENRVSNVSINNNDVLEIDYLKEDVKSLKMAIRNIDFQSFKDDFNSKLDEIDEAIKNLVVKTSYLELSKDRTPNDLQEIEDLKNSIQDKNIQIIELTNKITYLNNIIEEDNKNLKLVARYIINQAKDIQILKDELEDLKNKIRS